MRRPAPILAACLCVLAALPASGSVAPEVSGLRGPPAVERFARFETTASISPEPENPFDPAQMDVRGHFLDPGGREWTMPGFWYQGFRRRRAGGREVLTAVGDPVWKVRFAPHVAGTWEWWWTARTPAGTTVTPRRSVEVRPSGSHGFVRQSPHDVRYLAFDDGSPYFAVGENVAWYDPRDGSDLRGTFAYDSWYGRLAEQGATYARLWMPSWAFGIEWADTGPGDYGARLDRAWRLDYVIQLGEQLGIYQLLSLQNHGPFSTTFNSEWGDNPYNQANGGPLSFPGEVYTNEAAKDLLKRRFRYIVARWGYSTHVLAWELWNEADLVDGYAPPISAAWHREMAEYLRSIDPAGHLVTTSFAITLLMDPVTWTGAGLDYTQLHFYSRSDVGEFEPDIARNMATWVPLDHARYRRPVLFAEFGVDARGPAETARADPDGIAIHDGLWAGALSGAFGTGMTWWWDNYIDLRPEHFYPMFGAIARFVAGVEWDREEFVRTTAVAASPSRPLLVVGLQGPRRALMWVKNDRHQWNHPDPAPVADATLTLTGLAPGGWCGAWWDTAAGAPREPVSFTAGPEPVHLAAPAFVGDVALRIQAC